jgi:hypothetical protein
MKYFAVSISGPPGLIGGTDADAVLGEVPSIIRMGLRKIRAGDVASRLDEVFFQICSKVDKFFNFKVGRSKEGKPPLHVAFAYSPFASQDDSAVVKGLSFWDCASEEKEFRASEDAFDETLMLEIEV